MYIITLKSLNIREYTKHLNVCLYNVIELFY